MRKVISALPSIKYMTITVAVCLVLGVLIADGFHPRALFGLVVAVAFLAMATNRNYDLMRWEAYHDPHAHSMRLQRDVVVARLRSVVGAYDGGDGRALDQEMGEARELLAEMRPSTTAR